MNWKIFKRAVINASAMFAYVTAIGLFMSSASHIFGEKDTVFSPVAVLMLLVFSAALMGILLFGQPVLWYADGRKKDALYLLGCTMASLLALTLLTFVVLLITK